MESIPGSLRSGRRGDRRVWRVAQAFQPVCRHKHRLESLCHVSGRRETVRIRGNPRKTGSLRPLTRGPSGKFPHFLVVGTCGCATVRIRQHARKGGENHREICQNSSSSGGRYGSSQPRRLRQQAQAGSGSEQRRPAQVRTQQFAPGGERSLPGLFFGGADPAGHFTRG